MGLFQNSVLNKYKKLQDKKAIEKAFKKYAKYFHNTEIQNNIRESKEEQYQEGFLRELFVNILGYTINPNPDFNLTTELKNEIGAKKADGAILEKSNNPLAKPKAIAVIELKGTKTKDLESIRQQAFDYKANQSSCVYVITSNFEKLRFYINNAVEFEEFNLFTLTAERFELLYLCLHKQNLLQNLPLKVNTDSVVAEEQITKTFYNDYSLFKRELFRDLVKKDVKNEVFRGELEKEDNDRATKNIKRSLFKKSQKLIDRFLFIFFAEDKGLLPPNSTLKILIDWNKLNELDTNIPLYNRFKLYFKYLDEGRKGTDKKAEIFAYNGGLFKPDAILDSLLIDNDLLYKHTKKLSDYDFESQVGVNILGHIFENSLNEIESVNAEIEGQEFDKQKTKRKKDGVFYTPKYITKYIVDNTVGKLCEEKKIEFSIIEAEYQKSRKGRKKETLIKLKANLDTYRKWLLELTILDPACGSGAFLNQALDYLIKEHTYIDELETTLLGDNIVFQNIENTILEKNIFGVDLNEESVEIAKLSLWLRTAQPRRKLNTLNNNIKCGNSLIDDPKIAGDKAFNWQTEFPHIFKEKEKNPYHITWVTHNSRTSQRMTDHKVKKGDAVWLNDEWEYQITRTIVSIVKEDNLNIMAYNICGDHIHLLLVSEKDEVPNIIRKLKGKSSQKLKEYLKIPKEETFTLWAQKYSNTYIDSEEQLWNTVEYIRNNKEKHELERSSKDLSNKGLQNLSNKELQDLSNKGLQDHLSNKGLQPLVAQIYHTYEHAFREEYKGGFDVVIGNPPYVPTEYINDKDKIYLEQKYDSAYGRINLYPIFYEKGIKILNSKGILSFITPYTILKNQYYVKARKFILENTSIDVLIDFKGITIFKDAAVDSIILTLSKNIKKNNKYIQISDILDFESNQYKVSEIIQSDIYNSNDLSFNVSVNDKLIKRISKNYACLSNIVDFNQGIITGNNKKYITTTIGDYTKKVIMGRDFNRYSFSKPENYIIYDIEKLHRPRKIRIFEVSEKLLLRQTGAYPISTIDTNSYYTLDTVHNGLLLDENYDLRYILSLLNSKTLRFLYENSINESGKVFAQVKIIYIDPLPIKKLNIDGQKYFVNKVNKLLEINKTLSSISLNFTTYLQSKYSIKKLTKKLQNWHKLEFGEFIKEINKAIHTSNKGLKPIVANETGNKGLKPLVANETNNKEPQPLVIDCGDDKPQPHKPIPKLTKTDEMEWMELFETKKAEAQALKTKIDKTDKEIDQMVYELYELTAEEIIIIENSTK